MDAFCYIVLFSFYAAQPAGSEASFRADAPLLQHNVKPKMIPSTAKGKKAFTDFKRIAESPKGWALWEASVDFFRPHQIRAHAVLHEVPVMGDALYGGAEAPTQRELHPKKQREHADGFRQRASYVTESFELVLLRRRARLDSQPLPIQHAERRLRRQRVRY